MQTILYLIYKSNVISLLLYGADYRKMEIDLTPSTQGTCVESWRYFGQLWYPTQNCYKKPTCAA